MRYLKTYESLSFDNKLDSILEGYVVGKITDKELFTFLETSSINESLFDNISNAFKKAKGSTEEALFTLCVKVYIKMSELLDKFKKYAGKIFKVLLWIVK